jgi:hypothetical protein
MGSAMPDRIMVMDIDLTGSKLGPIWRSVRLEVDMPDDWTTERLRRECAAHYVIPVANVTDPWPKRFDDPADDDDIDGSYPCIDHGIVGCGDCSFR